MNQNKPARISLRRSFSASMEAVFDAWLIPYLAGSWMFGPKSSDQEIITLENEPRVDGSFLFVVKRDGQKKTFTGQYMEIRRPEKLVCSWGQDQKSAAHNTLTMTLETEDGKTRIKLTHEIDNPGADGADIARTQWNTRFKALADLVERPMKQRRLFK